MVQAAAQANSKFSGLRALRSGYERHDRIEHFRNAVLGRDVPGRNGRLAFRWQSRFLALRTRISEHLSTPFTYFPKIPHNLKQARLNRLFTGN